MNYIKKYNKYKVKFSKLHCNQIGGARYVIVENNSGALDGMSNQCLFISILGYLRNTYPYLTIKQLRRYAGLNENTEHTIFDINNEYHREAITRITERYNLQISFFPVTMDGQILYNGNIIDVIGNGINRFNIAQYGIYHFQRILNIIDIEDNIENNIDDDDAILASVLAESRLTSMPKRKIFKKSDINPYVKKNNKLVPLKSLPVNEQKLNNDIYELQMIAKYSEKNIKNHEQEYHNKLTEKSRISSLSISSDEKRILLISLDEYLNKLVNNINDANRYLHDIQNQIKSLESILNL